MTAKGGGGDFLHVIEHCIVVLYKDAISSLSV